MNIHLTARPTHLPVRLTQHEVASWLWPRLRRAFPLALACVLMPGHPHLVTPVDDTHDGWRRFKNVISGLRRSSNPGALIRWEPLPPPDVLGDRPKTRRMSRYVTLNPSRARLVEDPLQWPWSTHRDVMGATVDPWVEAERLAGALGFDPRGFAEDFHRYVSSAPSVCVAGTPPPQPATPTPIALQPLHELLAAAASATRCCPADVRRRGPTRELFLALALRHGWDDSRRLAELCGVAPRTIRWRRRHLSGTGLQVAQLCLGDARLRRWEVDG